MIDYERPPAGRQEYAELDNDAITAYCYRLDDILERAPTELHTSDDVTALKHESSYDGLVESGRGEIVPVRHDIQIRGWYFSVGPIRRQYEVAVAHAVERSLLPGGFIDNELYFHPRMIADDFRDAEFEQHVEEYIFLVHRDGSMSAYVESVDLSREDGAVTDRNMVLYDALQLDNELGRIEALHAAVSREEGLTEKP